MKIKLLIVSLVVVLSGCQALKFDRYPGNAIPNFSEELQGTYIIIDNIKNLSDTDTLTITPYTILENGESIFDLVDTQYVVSVYKSDYFLFINRAQFWMGCVLQKNENELIVTPILNPNPKKSNSRRNFRILKRYFDNVNMLTNKEKINVDGFSVKMDEEQLLKYLKKYDKSSIKLIQLVE